MSESDRDEARQAERDMSDAYLRLRAMIPGALNTPHAPTPEQVWETTEAALRRRLLQERDIAEAIHHEIISPEIVEYALEVWRDSLPLKTWSDADRMKSVLSHVSSSARILAEARTDYPDNPDFVAAQRFAPWGTATEEEWRSRLASQCGQTLAARHERDGARREERERCARAIEARAYHLRDHGPTSPEGLLTALAGAQVGALLDAASLLRNGGVEAARDPSRWEGPRVDLQYGRMQDALERILSWSEAYPLDIFPEPDLRLARELLAAGGITLDAVSAHCMRHVIDGVGKIARGAIRDTGDTPAKTGGAS